MTVSEEYEIEARFIRANSKKVKNITNGISYCCLYHDDDKPSASHVLKDNKVLDYCSICGNIHTRLKKDSGAWEKYQPKQVYSKFETFLYYNTLSEYKYYDFKNEKYLYSVFRLKDKRKGFPVGVRDGTHITSGTGGINTSLAVFTDNIRKLKQAVSDGTLIIYTEGEKDCLTVTKNNYAGFSCGGCNKFREALLPYLKGGKFIVFSDNDSPGIKDAERITALLNTVGNAIMIIPPEVPLKGDITDYMESHTKEDLQELIDNALNEKSVKENVTGVAEHDISATELIMDDKVTALLSYREDSSGNKKVLQTVRNFEIVLENDRRFAGKIRFDEFSQQTFMIGSVPWENKNNYRAWSSSDDSALFAIIQSDYGLNSRNDCFDALKNVSMRNKFHPVRDMLDSLVWDGKEKICNLFVDYLGAEDTEYTHQATRLWMLGGVARIYQPGCKFDYILILVGAQGIGKSTMLQFMALDSAWFNDSLDSLDSDKAAQSLMGSWIIELAELKSLARTAGGVDSVKRFLTSTQDKYRIPYEKRADVFPRQCVFAGTTNRSDFLQDETGNRRFLIVPVGINKPKKNLFSPDAIGDIKAAWAEAAHIWKTEKPKLVLPDSCRERAEELQAESMADDGKVGIISEYLENKQRTCAIEIWNKALNEPGRPQKWQASEINTIVLGLPNWVRMSSPAKFGEYGSQRGFQRVCSNNLLQSSKCESNCSSEFIAVTDEELKDLPFT